MLCVGCLVMHWFDSIAACFGGLIVVCVVVLSV